MSGFIINTARRYGSLYSDYADQLFEDGERIIDYILVYKVTNKSEKREVFLRALIEIGIELEEAISTMRTDLRFVKVHVPKPKLFEFAKKYDIPIKKLQTTYIKSEIPKLKCLRNELTSQDPTSPNYHRAVDTMSGEKPSKCLRNERILITYNILKRIVFGRDLTKDIGIHHLIDQGGLTTAYAPHDGTSTWDYHLDTPLNDRQLLRRYWSSPNNFFKAQPLDVIERYFGDNIALYFAWLSFYNKMLLGPLLAGAIVTFVNWSFLFIQKTTADEACHSDKLMCPRCPKCRVNILKSACIFYQLDASTDNMVTAVFAMLISFWAAIYMVLWKRREAVLDLRWNIRNSELEEQDVRPEFENFAKKVRINDFGEPELKINTFTTLWRKSVSIILTFLMVAAVTCLHYFGLVFEMHLRFNMNNSVYAGFLSSVITIVIIMILRQVYEPIVIWLVNLEVPRTQTQFDNSYIIKIFSFSFMNNYAALIYTAFIKGKFYTYPGDPNMYASRPFSLTPDYCDACGCTSEVFITFLLLTILLPLSDHLTSYVTAAYKEWIYDKNDKRARISQTYIPRWEKDYELSEAKSYDLLKLYEEMVVEYGFVTLFAFAFPIAPLFALINSVIKTHIDAHNLVVKLRRPQAKRTATVGSWSDIMYFLTYCSIFTNALYITFTSDTIPMVYYADLNKNLKTFYQGYLNFTTSKYIINLDHWPDANVPNGTVCYYPGIRYDPDHELAYLLTFDHYYILVAKIVWIIIAEHLIWAITGLISYSIPSYSSAVREKYAVETMELRKYLAKRPSVYAM